MSHIFLLFGASRGIGAATAQSLARRGAQVCVTARDEARVKDVCARAGGNVWGTGCDISDDASVAAAVQTTLDKFGRIDTVINFAAFTGPLDGASWQLKQQDWDRAVAINMTGPANIIRHCTPVMQKQGNGALLFASSPFGDATTPGMGAYGASRAGSHALVRQLAAELQGTALGAALIYPGMTETDGLSDFRKSRGGAMQNAQVASAETMANLFVWAAMQSPWDINGATLAWSDQTIRTEAMALGQA